MEWLPTEDYCMRCSEPIYTHRKGEGCPRRLTQEASEPARPPVWPPFETFSGSKVLLEILEERKRQDAKFGKDRNHCPLEWSGILHEEYLEATREVVDGHFEFNAANRDGHWRKLRTELIQVAAVAVAFVESLDRNELKYDKKPSE